MKPRHRVFLIVLGLAAIASSSSPALAQMEHQAGGYLLGSFPISDWGKIAGFGMGLDATDIIRFGPNKPLSWRVSTGVVYNFSRTEEVPPTNLLPTSSLELETKNWSLLFGIGPEFGKRDGHIMPFMYGTAGFDTYWTSSTLQGTAGGLAYEAEHGDSRISFAWAAGLGLRRRVMEGYMGELSVEFRQGASHHFLLPEQITEDVTGVHADRASRSSNQIIVRLGTVISD
ncbi:MAG TPA: hypothetical protein VFQ05_16640 [Candidatus Eisenbacteria bacterium]|nr:hypothetical protein [Candidatus Eisenbacteria bacterium]